MSSGESDFSPESSVSGRLHELQNSEAEQSVLSACLTRGATEEIALLLSPESFVSDVHRRMFSVFCELAREGKPVDLVSASEILANGARGVSPVYLAEVACLSVSRPMALHHAKIVQDLYIRRRLSIVAHRGMEAAFNREVPISEVISGITSGAEGILSCADKTGSVAPGEAVKVFMDRLARMREGTATLGVQTRFPMINTMLGGIAVPGDVVVLAARPGMGKTAFALNIVDDVSRRGVGTGVLSLEMPVDQLMGRSFASGALVDGAGIRNGRITHEDWERIVRYAQEFSERPVRYFDGANARPSQLRIMIQRWKREMGLRLLVVDYLQLMRPDVRSNNREREIAEISGTIKRAAVEFNIGVLLLCQLNRSADNEVPRLSHLRESGSIEQDADAVVFIRNWEQGQQTTLVEMDIAKNRHGPTGTFQQAYLNRFLRFENVASTSAYAEV